MRRNVIKYCWNQTTRQTTSKYRTKKWINSIIRCANKRKKKSSRAIGRMWSPFAYINNHLIESPFLSLNFPYLFFLSWWSVSFSIYIRETEEEKFISNSKDRHNITHTEYTHNKTRRKSDDSFRWVHISFRHTHNGCCYIYINIRKSIYTINIFIPKLFFFFFWFGVPMSGAYSI